MYENGAIYDYCECLSCGVLYLKNKVRIQLLYDNKNYYSFYPHIKSKENLIKSILDKKRYKSEILKSSFVGNLLTKIKPLKAYNLTWIKQLNFASYQEKILDVGCGNGQLLNFLSSVGFVNLSGIDPFLEEEISTTLYKIEKKELLGITETFDVIMFHHVLEHIDNPIETLLKAKELLNADGRILIRIPFKDSYAWEKYKENWVQIDAPRHVIIYSKGSLEILFNKVGLEIIDLKYDSTSFQFWGSEQYLHNIALCSPNSYHIDPSKSVFSNEKIIAFDNLAEDLNKNKNGDQVSIILKNK
ncbi:MAG: class I SAM-dependent methyltransferase [Ignavibacteriaceae bacterium]|jgi:SAM-dependent methyltransferase